MVGASRWRWYAIDKEKLDDLAVIVDADAKAAPKSPNAVQHWLTEVMTTEEHVIFNLLGSTKRTVLEELRDSWKGKVSKRAGAVLLARQSKYRLDLINKLKLAGRFHASADIIGALSGRKSGSGGDLNSQGIGREIEMRECFPLADRGMVLCGGDFESFEVTITCAVYGDEKMAAIVQSDKKIHAVFGTYFYPDMSYDEIISD